LAPISFHSVVTQPILSAKAGAESTASKRSGAIRGFMAVIPVIKR
jgi:hypothetical protein